MLSTYSFFVAVQVFFTHGEWHPLNTNISFPRKEFFDDIDLSSDELVRNSFLCEDQGCCECTSVCHSSRSCCIDKEWNHFQQSRADADDRSLSAYLDWIVDHSSQHVGWECSPLLSGADFMSVTHYMMITSCPRTKINSRQSLKCQKNDFSLPVLTADGALYKNEFCARCNGEFHYVVVGLTMQCNYTRADFVQQNFIINQENCTIRIDLNAEKLILENELYPCRYPTNYARDCPPSSPYYKLCNSYLAYSYGFANPHCMKCANYTAKKEDTEECSKSSSNKTKINPFDYRPELQFSYSLLFQFDDNFGCSPKNMRQKDLRHCSWFECAKHLVGVDSECMYPSTTLDPWLSSATPVGTTDEDNNEDVDVNNHYNLTSADQFTKCLLREKTVGLIAMCPPNLVAPTKDSLLEDCLADRDFDFDFQMKRSDALYMYVGDSPLKLYEELSTSCSRSQWLSKFGCMNVQATSMKKQKYTKMYGLDVLRNFPNGATCQNYTRISAQSIHFEDNCSFSWQGQTFKYDEYLLVVKMTRKENFQENVIVCNRFHLRSSCPKKDLKVDTGYYFDQRDHLFPYNNIGPSYSPEDYEPYAKGFRVCSETLREGTLTFRNEEVVLTKQYITICGLPISIIGYALVVGVYVYLKELHNKTGFGLIWLCVSLASSDGIMLALALGGIDKWMHIYVAIALHWCFLNALSWITILAVGLLGLLKSEYTLVRQHFSKKCFQSWIIATLVPSVVIVSLVFLNHYHPTLVGYGRSLSNSLMINKTTLYATVLAPFLVTNIFSLCILMAIIIKLNLHRQLTDQIGINMSNGVGKISVVKAAIKLVALFGVAELLGLVHTNDPMVNNVFSTLYVFVRSVRGVLICLLYVFNIKVRRLLRDQFRGAVSSQNAMSND